MLSLRHLIKVRRMGDGHHLIRSWSRVLLFRHYFVIPCKLLTKMISPDLK